MMIIPGLDVLKLANKTVVDAANEIDRQNMAKNQEKGSSAEETQEFEIRKLEIKGEDFREIFTTLKIKESIFENFITGEVVISDTESLIEELGIIGEEEITIEVGFPEHSNREPKDIIKIKCHIYKIDNRTREGIGQSIEEYTIYFCDKIALNDKLVRVSKTYKKGTISSYVQKIFKEELQAGEVNAEETQNNFEINIPNLNPISAINFLSNFSYKSFNDGGDGEKRLMYLFYQDRKQFNFKSIEEMIKSSKSVADILFDKSDNFDFANESQKNVKKDPGFLNTTLQDVYETVQEVFSIAKVDLKYDVYQAESYEILKAFSNYESAETGYFGFTNYSSDILSKTLHKIQYKYSEDFNKMPKLSKVETKTNKYKISEIPFSTKIYSKPTTKGRLDSKYVEESLGKQIEHYTETRDPLKNTKKERIFMGPKFKILLPGNNKIMVGDTVNLKFPSFKLDDDEKRTRTYEDDEIYSGKYLVFEIEHTFTRFNKWNSFTSCVSDSIKNHKRG